MPVLTGEPLEWLAQRVPDAPVSPGGGRPATDKPAALRGMFWILDNGAKRKSLPRQMKDIDAMLGSSRLRRLSEPERKEGKSEPLPEFGR